MFGKLLAMALAVPERPIKSLDVACNAGNACLLREALSVKNAQSLASRNSRKSLVFRHFFLVLLSVSVRRIATQFLRKVHHEGRPQGHRTSKCRAQK
jgi:hypothetical protein